MTLSWAELIMGSILILMLGFWLADASYVKRHKKGDS